MSGANHSTLSKLVASLTKSRVFISILWLYSLVILRLTTRKVLPETEVALFPCTIISSLSSTFSTTNLNLLTSFPSASIRGKEYSLFASSIALAPLTLISDPEKPPGAILLYAKYPVPITKSTKTAIGRNFLKLKLERLPEALAPSPEKKDPTDERKKSSPLFSAGSLSATPFLTSEPIFSLNVPLTEILGIENVSC